MTAKEKRAYLDGLRYAKDLCDMAEAGFKSGRHMERAAGAKLCSEGIGDVLKRELPADQTPDG